MPGTLPRALTLAVGLAVAGGAHAEPQHGIAMYGDPKYGADFTHFDYANPDAPRGGTLRLANITASTFDSLNPFILRGTPAAGLGYTYETLTVRSLDEPFTEYGRVAESIEIGPERRWVRFELRPEARFHDGEPLTADDVVFSFETLKRAGHPRYRFYYQDVERAEREGEHTVRFHFRGDDNRELSLIIGQLPILAEHYWEDREFDQTTLEAPLGSGPYRVTEMEQGRRIVYERVDDYWGDDLPVNRGHYNFERITYDYYRDATVALQALKAGEYDLRLETIARNWATAYDTPAAREGYLRKLEIPHDLSGGMQGFFYNTRRSIFEDPRVREALAYAFDFDWANRNLFYDAYIRTESYFSNSELAADQPPSERELELLEPYRDELPPRVFDSVYDPPDTTGGRSLRDNLRHAFELLAAAGWEIRDQRLTHAETGEVMRFEILLSSAAFERVVLPFAENLQRLGIEADVRTVDPTQYQNRIDNFDFDMTVHVIGQSLSPGNEQRAYWGCAAAETPGSENIAGICDPVIDELIDKLIRAPSREALVARTRALDRVLLWNFYVIPHWHNPSFRIAYWDKFGRPEETPPYGFALDSWWVEPEKATRIEQR